MFEKGYAVGLLTATNTQRTIGCNKVWLSRDFNIVLTRRYNSPSRDIPARIAAEKNIFEDQILIIKAIEEDPQSDNITKMTFVSDNGLEFLEGDRFGFLVLQSTINVEYYENL